MRRRAMPRSWAVPIGIAGLVALMTAAADAAIALPSACSTLSTQTARNITFLTGTHFPLNATIGNLDDISSGIFQTCGKLGEFIATTLGSIETIWFIIQSVVFKQRMEEMIKDMLFKSMTVLTVIALVVGLSGSNANVGSGGNLVKGFSFGLFTQFANLATSKLGIPAPIISGPTARTEPGQAIEGASDSIIRDGLVAADAIVTCPANAYYADHQANNPVQSLSNIVAYIAGLPGEFNGWFLALGVMGVYSILDMLLIATLIDGMIVLSVGVFTLGFANSRWTSDNASSYFKLMFSVGWKVFSYVFVANLGVVLIDDCISNELSSLPGFLETPSLPISGDAAIVIVLLLICVLMFSASSISKALSSGTFSVGVGSASLVQAVSLATLVARAGSSLPSAGGGKPQNGIAAGGVGASSSSGNAGRPPVPPAPVSGTGLAGAIASSVTRGIESHEVNSPGITFRPHS